MAVKSLLSPMVILAARDADYSVDVPQRQHAGGYEQDQYHDRDCCAERVNGEVGAKA